MYNPLTASPTLDYIHVHKYKDKDKDKNKKFYITPRSSFFVLNPFYHYMNILSILNINSLFIHKCEISIHVFV